MSVPARTLTRRGLLLGGVGLVVASSGCARIPPSDPPTAPAPEPGGRAPATLSELVAQRPFYIAHRGGGANWPEMTGYAYAQAAALPWVRAMEVSVCLSADGVLVCSHDPSTARVTGVDLEIARTEWSELAKLRVTGGFTDQPDQPAQPLTRFDEVAERHLPHHVLFVEPKTPVALEPLLRRLADLGQPERTVWKQPVNQPHFARAKEHGFGTWGYVLDEPGHLGERLPRFAADPAIDMLGIATTQPDDVITRVTGLAGDNGKAVVMWPIYRTSERARGLALGCRGMMTSDIRDIPPIPL